MDSGYKVSRELGRKPSEEKPIPEEEIESILDVINTDVDNVEAQGRFYWLNNFTGTAKNGVIIKSDFYEKLREVETSLGTLAVGMVILDEGSIQLIFGEVK